jgi:hypothetical protein
MVGGLFDNDEAPPVYNPNSQAFDGYMRGSRGQVTGIDPRHQAYMDDRQMSLAMAEQYGNRQAPWMNQQNSQAMPAAQSKGVTLADAAQVGVPQAQVNTAQGATAGPVALDTSQSNQTRDVQGRLVGQLEEQAAGRGPSLATAQMNQGVQAGLKAQLAGAASQRGFGNAASSARSLSRGASEMQGNAIRDSAQARIQEQLNARSQLSGLSTNMRSQDEQRAGTEAGRLQQGNQFNAAQTQNVNLANAGMLNQGSQFNAGMTRDVSLANAMERNRFALEGARFNQQNEQFNVANRNDRDRFNAEQRFRTEQQNMQGDLQNRSLNDAMVRDAMGNVIGIDQDRIRSGQAYETLRTNASVGQGSNAVSLANANNRLDYERTKDLFNAGAGAAASYARTNP